MTSLHPLPAEQRALLDKALRDGIVVETSGSTAAPKRVVLSADALRASARATTDAIGRGNWVLALPLTYIAGIMVVVRALVDETDVVDLRAEPFDAARFAEAVIGLPDGTWLTSMVPAQLVRLVDLAENDVTAATALTRFDTILVGGQAIPEGLVERARALGARIIRTYGSAETAGGVVYDGLPIGDTQLRIAADGVLEISSSSLATGYLGDDERTAASFVDGWFRTRDRAHMNDGRLVIDGRVDDIIVTGGVKVSLFDIERVALESGIEVVATWYPDDEWGQVPAVVSEASFNPDNLRALVESRLGKAARPHRVVTLAEIPRLSSGKVDRVAIQQLVAGREP